MSTSYTVDSCRSLEVGRILPARFAKKLATSVYWKHLEDLIANGVHLHEVKTVNELLEELHLPADARIAAAWLLGRIVEYPVLAANRK